MYLYDDAGRLLSETEIDMASLVIINRYRYTYAAAKKFGVDVSECLFFDDNLTALKTAKAAGMRTVGVYDLSSKNSTQQIKDISDYYIENFNYLKWLEIFKNQD